LSNVSSPINGFNVKIMGLLTILKKLREEEKEMRVLMLGLDGAGKTTVVRKLLHKDVNVIEPTLGFNIDTIQYDLNSESYNVNVWDVGGQKSIRTFWKNYFEKTEGLIWVVDCGDRSRLAICREEMHKLLKEERLQGATLLVLANKQDLVGAATHDEIRQLLKLDDIKTHHWCIEPISATKDEVEKLQKSFGWLVDDISSRVFTMD